MGLEASTGKPACQQARPASSAAVQQKLGFAGTLPWDVCRLPVLSLFAAKNPEAAGSIEDPEGGAQGCAPFFDRARMASRKIPIAMKSWDCFVGKSVFLWFVSFDAYQKK
jgi:hypothetical protein